MNATLEENKAVVRRFNTEIIERGNAEVFKTIMHPDFVNHTAAAGIDKGSAGVWHTLNNILRAAISDMKVTIHDQIAEGNLVTTRKTISGKHTGTLMGAAATQQDIAITVIDIVRVKDGQYLDHWGMNNIAVVAAQLAAKQ